MLGRERLTELLEELGPNTSAQALIDRAAQESRVSADDIAAVVISPTAGVTAGLFRTEQLELSSRELEGTIARRFLESCGLPADEVAAAVAEARTVADASAAWCCTWCSGTAAGWRCSRATWRASSPPRAAPPPARGRAQPGRAPAIPDCQRPRAKPSERLGDRVGAVLHEEVPGVVELHGLGGGEHLPPLVEEHRLEHAVAHAPDEQGGHVELEQPVVDGGDQVRAAVALGQRVSPAGTRADPRVTSSPGRARGRRPSSPGRCRAAPCRRGSTPRTGSRPGPGSRPAPRSGTRAGRAARSSAAPTPRCSSAPGRAGGRLARAAPRARSGRPSRGPPGSRRAGPAGPRARACCRCGRAASSTDRCGGLSERPKPMWSSATQRCPRAGRSRSWWRQR